MQQTAHIHSSVHPILLCFLDVFFFYLILNVVVVWLTFVCLCVCVSLFLFFSIHNILIFVIFDLSPMILVSVCDVCSVLMLRPLLVHNRFPWSVRQWTRTTASLMATFLDRPTWNMMWPPPYLRKLPQSSNCDHYLWSVSWRLITIYKKRPVTPVLLQFRWLPINLSARSRTLSTLSRRMTIMLRSSKLRNCFRPQPPPLPPLRVCPFISWCWPSQCSLPPRRLKFEAQWSQSRLRLKASPVLLSTVPFSRPQSKFTYIMPLVFLLNLPHRLHHQYHNHRLPLRNKCRTSWCPPLSPNQSILAQLQPSWAAVGLRPIPVQVDPVLANVPRPPCPQHNITVLVVASLGTRGWLVPFDVPAKP